MKLSILNFSLFVFLVSIFIYFYIFTKPISRNNPIHSDGEGYYAYLPAILLEREISVINPSRYETTRKVLQFPAFNLWEKTDKYLNKYPMGVAILLLPGFLLATIVSFITGFPLDGYNIVYQHFAGISASVYLALGVLFLFKVYSKYFSRNISYLTILTLIFATNLLHYSTYDSTFSHVFGFFVISTSLYLIQKWYQKADLINSAVLGFFFGLSFLVRNTHIVLFLIFFLYGIYSKKSLFKNFNLLLNRKIQLLWLILAFSITIFPQFMYYYSVTGSLYVFSYVEEGFNWFSPAWYGVLFSPRKGFFFWAPVFFLMCFSVFQIKKIRKWVLAALIVITIETYLIASWHQWWYGDSFGHRGFIDIYPVLGIFLGASLSFLLKKRVVKYFTLVSLGLFIVLNLFLMTKYWVGVLPRDHTTIDTYLKIFKSYLLPNFFQLF